MTIKAASTQHQNPPDATDEDVLPQSPFRGWIGQLSTAEFPPERDRYHLYVAYASPWAHQVMIVRQLKGLEEDISVTAVHWRKEEKGWRFASGQDEDAAIGMTSDPHHPQATHLRELYIADDPEYAGRFSTPVLYDTKSGKIVSNSSSDILRMLSDRFDSLLPPAKRESCIFAIGSRCKIGLANEWIHHGLNSGVFRAGYAQTKQEHERATREVFSALTRAETQLGEAVNDGPFFFGPELTETDIRLFTTLVRFDPVFVRHFKLRIFDIRTGFPELHRWMRWLYWTVPAFKDTTNFEHIKRRYMPNGGGSGAEPDILSLDEDEAAAAAAAAAADKR